MRCKLFDLGAFGERVAASYREVDPGKEAESYVAASRKRLRMSTLLDARNLYEPWREWLERQNDGFKEFSHCTPPWPHVFIYAGESEGCEFGLQCEAMRTDGLENRFPDADPEARERLEETVVALILTKWSRASTQSFVQAGYERFCVCLDRQGTVVSAGAYGMPGFRHDASQLSVFTFALFAIQLIHCRNVVQQEAEYRPNLPRGKRHKVPRIVYRTLSIGNSSPRKSQGSSKSANGETAKHVCRGNFAHYTEENKLFGKYVGMFWRPMHIRGNAKHGIVGKEYAMEAPHEPA